uniref:Sulfotransferase domain-containing protein n=1 Tax=viral metagenome TaxID=1070528 RepID=A0A6C0EW27_9ZZZZ
MVNSVIYIGKCGGATTKQILNINNIEHQEVHLTKPVFNENYKYVIIIRNPIDRFISAFNWRYKLVVSDKTQENRFIGEKDTLIKYDNVNNLAENITRFDINKSYIHHIYEDINFYLDDFLGKCKKGNIIGIVTQEDLEHDIEHIFNICVKNIHKNKNNTIIDKYISNTGYDLLKHYLYKDYECIDKLFAMGCLSDKQYNILSK